jgi:hypothetical protein
MPEYDQIAELYDKKAIEEVTQPAVAGVAGIAAGECVRRVTADLSVLQRRRAPIS